MIYILTCAKFANLVDFARKLDNTDQKSVIFDLGASFLLESSNCWHTTWEPYSKSTMNFWTETVHEIVHCSCTCSVPWCTMKIVQFKAHQWVSHTWVTPCMRHFQFSALYNRNTAVLKNWKVRKWVPLLLHTMQLSHLVMNCCSEADNAPRMHPADPARNSAALHPRPLCALTGARTKAKYGIVELTIEYRNKNYFNKRAHARDATKTSK